MWCGVRGRWWFGTIFTGEGMKWSILDAIASDLPVPRQDEGAPPPRRRQRGFSESSQSVRSRL
jgi:hypothetical protein